MNLKEASTKNWAIDDESPTHEELNTGALQRIAAACELMAKHYATLLSDRNYFERRLQEEQACNKRLSRSYSALRANYTRLKQSVKPPTAK